MMQYLTSGADLTAIALNSGKQIGDPARRPNNGAAKVDGVATAQALQWAR
jgi:hypothetical protein